MRLIAHFWVVMRSFRRDFATMTAAFHYTSRLVTGLFAVERCWQNERCWQKWIRGDNIKPSDDDPNYGPLPGGGRMTIRP